MKRMTTNKHTFMQCFQKIKTFHIVKLWHLILKMSVKKKAADMCSEV